MNRLDGTADTRMMAIVHRALHRDLERIRLEVTTPPFPKGTQRNALGEHAVWLMAFLHRHHAGEDAGLWPLVVRHNAGAAELVASLEADHRRIEPAIEALTTAGRRYAGTTDDAARQDLLAAVDQLCAVLLPHLDREVADGMPVVAASVSEREWRDWNQAYYLKPKSPAELAMEGHWLIDDLDPEGYQVVVHEVPPVLRFVLLHGFARAYRRKAASLWRGRPAPVVTR